jgi:hypothetical protein
VETADGWQASDPTFDGYWAIDGQRLGVELQDVLKRRRPANELTRAGELDPRVLRRPLVLLRRPVDQRLA